MAIFSKGNEQATTQQGGGRALADQVTMVGGGTVFEGTLRASGDVRISGRLVGTLSIDGKAIVAQEGAVEGEVAATSADIAGSVQGELLIEERLMLKSTARVDGNIHAGRIVVEEGALFTGQCEIGGVPGSEDSAEGRASESVTPGADNPEAEKGAPTPAATPPSENGHSGDGAKVGAAPDEAESSDKQAAVQ